MIDEPFFVQLSMLDNSRFNNKWIKEYFQPYEYVLNCETKVCIPQTVCLWYQVNDKNERDGMFVMFLENGTPHEINYYKKGKIWWSLSANLICNKTSLSKEFDEQIILRKTPLED